VRYILKTSLPSPPAEIGAKIPLLAPTSFPRNGEKLRINF
jgi:hypothetical protein